MFYKVRLLSTGLLLLLLLKPVIPIHAQDVQPTPGLPATAPDNGSIVLAANDHAEAAFLESITATQLDAIVQITEKYAPQLDALFTSLERPNTTAATRHLFLPLIRDGVYETESTTSQHIPAQVTDTAVPAMSSALPTQVEHVLNQMQQEFIALLTPEQKVLFERTPLASVPQAVTSSAIQEISGFDNCYTGGRYAALGFHAAAWARHYAYLDWKLVNNTDSDENFHYNALAESYAASGTIYAGGAYLTSMQGLSMNSWDYQADSLLTTARTNSYWGVYYAQQSWRKGSSYGRSAYYQAVAANNYLNTAVTQIRSC